MGRNKGICTLCGKGGPLSFEHVPPEGGLNVRGVVMYTFSDWMQRGTLDGPLPNGIPQPKGTGLNALCDTCNHFLGREYVPAHNRLVRAGLDLLEQLAPRLGEFDARPVSTIVSVGMKEIDRLACAKQIVSMLLVTSGRHVVEANAGLADFVRDPQARGLPSRYRLFLALAVGPAGRTTGLFSRGQLGNDAAVTAAAEVVYPPFAYGLVFNDCDLGSGGEITAWALAPFGESATVAIDLKVGFTHTAFPGDLRTRAQIESERRRNDPTLEALGDAHGIPDDRGSSRPKGNT